MSEHDAGIGRNHDRGPSPSEPALDEPRRDLDADHRQLGRDGLRNLPDAEAPGASVQDEESWAAVEPNEPG